MKRLTRKNRRMSVEAYTCACPNPDYCTNQCGPSALEMNTRIAGAVSLLNTLTA